MSRATESRLSSTAIQDELTAYILGIGKYAYGGDSQRRVEQSERVNSAIHALTHQANEDTESVVLRYGAQLAQVNRVLAAQFVAGALEALEAGSAWTHLSEAILFHIAVEHGRLLEYVSSTGDFAVNSTSEYWDPMSRYLQFMDYFFRQPDGPARHGLRLGLMLLFDGSTEAVAAGLALCDRMRGQDQVLDRMAADRLLLALERGEISRYGAAYHDLGAQLVAIVGRWGLTQALPYLYALLENTTTRDRASRVLRALVLRAIEQLGSA